MTPLRRRLVCVLSGLPVSDAPSPFEDPTFAAEYAYRMACGDDRGTYAHVARLHYHRARVALEKARAQVGASRASWIEMARIYRDLARTYREMSR